jgi:hypothetical protein
MRLLASFVSGTLFAFGLALSGMTQPDNVIGFLDFFGDWRPELMFVMGAAVVTLFALQKLLGGMARPVFEAKFRIPTRSDLNFSLLGGAALFGIGWGLVGFCPGPAIASLATLQPAVLYFLAAMAVGMTLHTKWERYLEKGQSL